MSFIKWALWTSFCIGLGVFLSTYPIGGRSAVEHVRRAWKDEAPVEKLERLKRGVGEAIDEARAGAKAAPKEHYTAGERADLNKLVAKRAAARK